MQESNFNLRFFIQTARDLELVRTLFLEYSAELEDDFCFQNFDEELATLPGKYSEPTGTILLAIERETNDVAGIVALRPFLGVPGACEMKRMYVRPSFRGEGVGRELAIAIIKAAKGRGFREMLLDTLERLEPAIALYRSLGFYEVEPYYDNPLCGVVYMRREL